MKWDCYLWLDEYFPTTIAPHGSPRTNYGEIDKGNLAVLQNIENYCNIYDLEMVDPAKLPEDSLNFYLEMFKKIEKSNAYPILHLFKLNKKDIYFIIYFRKYLKESQEFYLVRIVSITPDEKLYDIGKKIALEMEEWYNSALEESGIRIFE